MDSNTLRIGIDVSLDSIGFCFRQGTHRHYAALINVGKLDGSKEPSEQRIFEKYEYMRTLRDLRDVTLGFWDRNQVAGTASVGLDAWQRVHLDNCLRGQHVFIRFLDKILLEQFDGVLMSDIEVAFENYSYGSVTDNFIQVVEATVLLKEALIEKGYVLMPNLRIIPGPKIKMLAGSGALDKWGMLQAFQTNACKDPGLENDPLWRFLTDATEKVSVNRTKKAKKAPAFFANGKPKPGTVDHVTREVLAPVSDIIDAYFLGLYASRVKETVLTAEEQAAAKIANKAKKDAKSAKKAKLPK